MSVLIKGMKKPKDCYQCRLHYGNGECGVSVDGNCPIIEIPDHGDLIDKDSLVDKAEFIGDAFSGRGGFAVWGENVVNAPVVIPAERSEDARE